MSKMVGHRKKGQKNVTLSSKMLSLVNRRVLEQKTLLRILVIFKNYKTSKGVSPHFSHHKAIHGMVLDVVRQMAL